MLLGVEVINEAQELLASNTVGSAAVIIPVTTGIVQALKTVGLKDKFAPLAAIGVGAGISILTKSDLVTHTNAIFTGIVYGLASSGLYSGLVHSLQVGKAAQEPHTSPLNTNSGNSVMKTEEKSVKIERERK